MKCFIKNVETGWTNGLKIVSVVGLITSFCNAEYLGSYTARLSSRDHYNSSGHKLMKYYSILRQDRANYHKFYKRDSEDTDDNVFGSKKMRSHLSALVKSGNISSEIKYAIENGTPLVEVDIYSNHLMVAVKGKDSSAIRLGEYLGSYTAKLGSQDHYNSNGNLLTKYYSILRQDRANYHKFYKRDSEDTNDNIFSSKKMRLQMLALVKRSDISNSIKNMIENGTPVVNVDIYTDRLAIYMTSIYKADSKAYASTNQYSPVETKRDDKEDSYSLKTQETNESNPADTEKNSKEIFYLIFEIIGILILIGLFLRYWKAVFGLIFSIGIGYPILVGLGVNPVTFLVSVGIIFITTMGLVTFFRCSGEKCPNCNTCVKDYSEKDLIEQHYKHETKAGKPDLRYKSNPIISIYRYTYACPNEKCQNRFTFDKEKKDRISKE